MNNDRWVDSIVEAMQILGGEAHYDDLYALIRKIRTNGGLSTPPSFEEIVRRCVQDHSSDSAGFKGVRDIFKKLGKGYWGLREDYAEVKTFGSKPLEEQQARDFVHVQQIAFENDGDNLAISEDGKQLLDIEEAKLKKEHYKYEGRLKASQIKKIKVYKGYVCEACGLSFAKKYPGLGNDFIECHHKIPYADMKEGEARILNVDDFMVLCSNCHKMIHRLDNPADLEQLKAVLAKSSES